MSGRKKNCVVSQTTSVRVHILSFTGASPGFTIRLLRERFSRLQRFLVKDESHVRNFKSSFANGYGNV